MALHVIPHVYICVKVLKKCRRKQLNSVFHTAVHRKEFPLFKPMSESESDEPFTLCESKFIVKKPVEATKTTTINQPMQIFFPTDQTRVQLLGKELTLAYHMANNQLSGPMVDCNSKLISQLFDLKFTCSAKKALVQNVIFQAIVVEVY